MNYDRGLLLLNHNWRGRLLNNNLGLLVDHRRLLIHRGLLEYHSRLLGVDIWLWGLDMDLQQCQFSQKLSVGWCVLSLMLLKRILENRE